MADPGGPGGGGGGVGARGARSSPHFAKIIGSNCPGISETVPDFYQLSRVPKGSTTVALLVLDEVLADTGILVNYHN